MNINEKKVTHLILVDIRSTYNVGSIFRTADAAGISKIYLCGITPTPIDRFGRARKDIAKVALGAHTQVLWEYVEHAEDIVVRLTGEHYTIIALEQDASAVPYNMYSYPKHCALVVGNEVDGIATTLLARCDAIVEIPQSGTKESLNVSVAAGIAMFAIRDSI